MIKYSLILFIITLYLNISAQIIPQGAKYVKTTSATVFHKKDTIEHKVSYAYYDSLWIELTSTNSVPTKDETLAVNVLNTPTKQTTAYLNSNGDTTDFVVFIYDDKGNRIYNYQIRRGDTLVAQKRNYDEFGNSIELYNQEDGKYHLDTKSKYDKNNDLIYCETYGVKGFPIKIELFERSSDGREVKYYNYDQYGNKILKSKTIKLTENTSQIFYYYYSESWGYGINLIHKEGSYSIVEESENHKLKKLEIYNKKKKMTTSVYINYTEI